MIYLQDPPPLLATRSGHARENARLRRLEPKTDCGPNHARDFRDVVAE